MRDVVDTSRNTIQPLMFFADEAEGLRYKLYVEHEANCAEEVADGARTFPELPFGTVIYAVVANTRYWDRLSYTLRVEDGSP